MQYDEKYLWPIFSVYIRLRDITPGVDGLICRCFTCGAHKSWKDGDAGHGIPRQHLATKYNEQNNHFQCKRCNGFEGGMREVYKEKVNKLYGPQTWDLLVAASRQPCKKTKWEWDVMIKFYKEKVRLLKLKHRIT